MPYTLGKAGFLSEMFLEANKGNYKKTGNFLFCKGTLTVPRGEEGC